MFPSVDESKQNMTFDNNNNNNNNNNNTNQEQQPQVIDGAFAIMCPGQALNRNCLKLSNDRYIMEIENPGLVKSFGISILNHNQLPQDIGFCIYCSLPPSFDEWEFIGILHNEYLSSIFESPWIDIKGITSCNVVRIGFQLKSKEFLKSLKGKSEQAKLEKNNMIAAIKTEFAMRVADNLFNFMNSFVKTTNNGQMLIAPAKCLNQWHDRFKTKYIKDPKFMKN